jgi:uncharacterized membrane protein HdeD (DUF308 family)
VETARDPRDYASLLTPGGVELAAKEDGYETEPREWYLHPVLGIILLVVAFVVLNGLGGAGHTRADVFVALGVIFLVVGAFTMVTRSQ